MLAREQNTIAGVGKAQNNRNRISIDYVLTHYEIVISVNSTFSYSIGFFPTVVGFATAVELRSTSACGETESQ